MNAKRFIKDEQSVWSKDTEVNGVEKTIYSACVEVNEESIDMVTLFVREEKSMVWIKANSEQVVDKTVNSIISQINTGVIKPYRAFSETPFYNGQEQDINPTTEVELGRYSQIRLCPAAQHTTLHRQFVTLETIPVNAAQPELKLAEAQE